MESLSVEFAFNPKDSENWFDEGVNTGGEVEEMQEVLEKEAKEAWRALMKRAWEAVVRNEKGVVKKLVGGLASYS